ncbi:MAG TPA: LPS assembly protein LptD, partial [Thermodesulfobacteriota bacterium]|nr:LPS assembly protein LptD [Thermodesulfobacteriota bacterium]
MDDIWLRPCRIAPMASRSGKRPAKRFLGTAIFVLLSLFLPAEGFPQASLLKYDKTSEPIRMSADSITFDEAQKTYVAEGKVEIWQGMRKLTADRVVFNSETQIADATGNVVLVQGDDFIRGKEMKVDMETNLGIVIQGTLFLKRQNYYLRGEEIERVGENTYRILEGNFTTCNGELPAWRFKGRETIVVLEEYADIYGATFQIKNVPVLYFPYLVLPVKTERQSGFLPPRVGYSNTAGGIFGLSYFWAISKNTDATFNVDEYTIKGLGTGAEYRYIRKAGSAGSIYAYHIRESAEYRAKYTDPLDRGADRWQVDYLHNENFSPGFYSKVRIRAFSDREYFRDYGSTYGEQAAEQAYSFASLTKDWERYAFYGEARNTVDLRQEDKTTLQYYPVTNFTGMKQPVPGTPLFFDFSSSYGYFWREEGTTGQRLVLNPRVSLPLRFNGVELNSEVQVKESWYPTDQSGSQNVPLLGFRTSLGGDLYRIYDTGWATVQRFKHVIRPEVAYTYIPNVSQGNIPYYDLAVPSQNGIFTGITSRLVGKIVEPAGTRYHEYVYMRVGDLLPTDRPLDIATSPQISSGLIYGEVRLKAQRYFTLENITTFDRSETQFQTTYTTLGLSDNRGDGMFLEHSWRNANIVQPGSTSGSSSGQNQLTATLRARLFPSVDVTFAQRQDIQNNARLSTTYGVIYRHQCW